MPRTYRSKEAFRKASAYVHIHGVPHHPSSIRHLSGGRIEVSPKTRYEVIACPVCGRKYKKDVRVKAGHGCPHCIISDHRRRSKLEKM